MNRDIQLVLCAFIIFSNIQLSVSLHLDKKTEYTLYYELDTNCFKAQAFIKLKTMHHIHLLDILIEEKQKRNIDVKVLGCMENGKQESTENMLKVEEEANSCSENTRVSFYVKVHQLRDSNQILPLRKENINLLEACKNNAVQKLQEILKKFKARLSICGF